MGFFGIDPRMSGCGSEYEWSAVAVPPLCVVLGYWLVLLVFCFVGINAAGHLDLETCSCAEDSLRYVNNVVLLTATTVPCFSHLVQNSNLQASVVADLSLPDACQSLP